MLELRPYQREALDALYSYWGEGGGNGLIVLPTGAGKALVIAKLIEELLRDYHDMRIFNVTHSASLVEQNFKEFIGLCPFAPAGIYSASLGQRDTRAQVLFCGIQSVCNKVEILGAPDLIVVDEAHAISRNGNTQYGKFLAETLAINPERRVAGTTATDYRLDSGRLTEGDDRLFDDVVYEAKLTDLIEQGYLTRLVSAKTTSKIDLKGVGTRGGDYIPGQVSTAAERIIEDAVAEDMVLSEGRRAALFFSASKENATHIAECVRRHGRPCAVLTSDNSHETKKIFADFRAGNLWAISSVNMIGTGTNFPFVDFLSLIFSTKSAGKLVQWLGRGTRNCEGKIDCLVADHGKNLAYHGPIDQIRPKAPGESTGEQPTKLCPQDKTDEEGKTGCGELIPISRMTCHCCGYIFPTSEEEKITAHAAIAPVLSTAAPEWHRVTGRHFREHPPKPGKPPSVKCTYMLGLTAQNEWICPEHSGFAKSKADRYWLTHSGNRPFPKTVAEFLDRAEELKPTAEIQMRPSKQNPKYQDVLAWRAGATAQAEAPPSANDNWKPLSAAGDDWSDDIPF
jgi:DNA repair protein RadD